MATESTTDAVVQPQAEPSNPADWPFTYSRLSGLPGLLHIVALRLWSHLRLMLALLAGFTVAVALVMSIPVYAEAVGYRVLRDEFTQNTFQNQLRFEFLYRYLGGQGGLLTDQYAKLDAYYKAQSSQSLGLPIVQRGHYISSNKRSLVAPGTDNPSFASVNLASADQFEQHVELVDGRLPRLTPDGPVEVLMTEKLADRLRPQIDQVYYVLDSGNNPTGNGTLVKISGIWRPKDPDEPFWFYSEMLAEDILFTSTDNFFPSTENFSGRLLARDPRMITVALWFFGTDGSVIRSAAVPEIQEKIDGNIVEFAALQSGAQLDVSPGGVLPRHQQRVRDLTLTLTIFSIPLLGLVAYFVILIAGLVIQRQSMEIAMLRSRGVSRWQVLGIYLLEGLLLGLLALIPGPLLGELAALLMTWVRSFLDLLPVRDLPIELTQDAWQRAWQILALLIAASVVPAFAAAGHTIVSYKSERARLTRGPIWQRLGLDLILLAVVLYGYFQLNQRGTIAFLGVQASTGDPFTSPLLLLAPTLYIIAFGLLSLRLFPPIITVLTWLSDRLRGIVAVTALRYLARTSATYIGPVLLLVLTLSLSIFTASMAQTLDRQLFDQIYYTTGGDMQITDRGRPYTPAGGGTALEFVSARDYLNIPGVQAITRVLKSPATVPTANGSVQAQFVGIDRSNFAGIARWRSDYADEPIAALVSRLNTTENVLISRELADTYGLKMGDRLTLQVYGGTGNFEMPVVVAGIVKLFPTVYPEVGPFIVGNIGHAFSHAGGPYSYDLWLKLADDASRTTVELGIRNLGVDFIERGYAPKDTSTERGRPERQGLFGLLSVGFVASAFLTALGFLFYSGLSFQRRFIEFGMLRAIGLSSRQLSGLLAAEQALILGIGAIAGTLIGVSASQLFIPFMQVRSGPNAQTPPFLVEIAWERIGIIYLIFAVMLLGAVAITLLLLRRMKLFQAVKLGETI
jgi:putative ABC transport system permease protein